MLKDLIYHVGVTFGVIILVITSVIILNKSTLSPEEEILASYNCKNFEKDVTLKELNPLSNSSSIPCSTCNCPLKPFSRSDKKSGFAEDITKKK